MLDEIRGMPHDAGNEHLPLGQLDIFPHAPLMFVAGVGGLNRIAHGFDLQDEVVAIHIASSVGEPMQSLAAAEAIAGEGLRGDRYRDGTGFYSATPIDPGARTLCEPWVTGPR